MIPYGIVRIHLHHDILYALTVSPCERIRELSAQLLRASDPLVIQMVGEKLMDAISNYVADMQNDYPVIARPKSASSY